MVRLTRSSKPSLKVVVVRCPSWLQLWGARRRAQRSQLRSEPVWSGHNSIKAELGREKFKQVCSACHGVEGKGTQALGAPNLSDKIWLHGFGEDAIMTMVNNGKLNIMPAQKDRLSADQIKLVASYVWGLSNNAKTTAQAQ